MGQWTNRLYEYFRQPDSQVVSTKRLSASLKDRRHQRSAQVLYLLFRPLLIILSVSNTIQFYIHKVKTIQLSRTLEYGSGLNHYIFLQEELFKCANCNGTLASNKDDAIELTLYRQNGCRPGPGPCPGPGPQGPNPDQQNQAERGEGPPLREV